MAEFAFRSLLMETVTALLEWYLTLLDDFALMW